MLKVTMPSSGAEPRIELLTSLQQYEMLPLGNVFTSYQVPIPFFLLPSFLLLPYSMLGYDADYGMMASASSYSKCKKKSIKNVCQFHQLMIAAFQPKY